MQWAVASTKPTPMHRPVAVADTFTPSSKVIQHRSGATFVGKGAETEFFNETEQVLAMLTSHFRRLSEEQQLAIKAEGKVSKETVLVVANNNIEILERPASEFMPMVKKNGQLQNEILQSLLMPQNGKNSEFFESVLREALNFIQQLENKANLEIVYEEIPRHYLERQGIPKQSVLFLRAKAQPNNHLEALGWHKESEGVYLLKFEEARRQISAILSKLRDPENRDYSNHNMAELVRLFFEPYIGMLNGLGDAETKTSKLSDNFSNTFNKMVTNVYDALRPGEFAQGVAKQKQEKEPALATLVSSWEAPSTD